MSQAVPVIPIAVGVGLLGTLAVVAAVLASRRPSAQTIGGATPVQFTGVPYRPGGAAASPGARGISALSAADAGGSGAPLSQAAIDERDADALARMLAGEDRHRDVEIVIGWNTIERARRRGITVFRLLTGRSGVYGPQQYAGEVRYASTAGRPTDAQRRLAEDLIAGRVVPSRQVREHEIGAWVEKDVGGYTALRILGRQVHQTGAKKGKLDFGGIWGRLAGTKWFLYGQHDPVIGADVQTEDEAAQVLAQVPQIPAVDEPPPAVA